MRVNGRMAAGAAALVVAITVAVAAWAEPLTIRIGWVVTPGHMAPLIEALGKREPAVFKHLGQSYVLQPLRFNGTTPQIQAQAIGDLEVASFSTSAFALAITNAHLDERVVADVVADGHPGYFSENFVGLAEGPVRTVEDIKGRRVATNAIGSASDTAMRTMFRKHGIKDSDFTTVEANFANMPAMLDSGKVDLIGTLPQFAQELRSGKYRVLFTARDAVGRRRRSSGRCCADVIAAHRPALSTSSKTTSALSAGFSTRKTATRRSPSRRRNQTAEGRPRLCLHQGRLLPLARCAARCGFGAKRDRRQRRDGRYPEARRDRAAICRPVADRGSQAAHRRRIGKDCGRGRAHRHRPGQPCLSAAARPRRSWRSTMCRSTVRDREFVALARTERVRQEHPALSGRRLSAGRARHDTRRGQAGHRAGTRPRHRLPAFCAVSVEDGDPERALWPRKAGHGARRSGCAAPASSSTSSGSPGSRTAIPRNSRAA